MRRVLVVGRGRAGTAFATALRAAGWTVELRAHDALPTEATAVGGARGTSVVLLCVPDSAVAEVAASLAPDAGRVVAHCAGALGLDVLAGHPHVASLHPLVALPEDPSAAERLRRAWFAVAASSPVAADAAGALVDALEGRRVEVDDDARVTYHAAAVVASNHLVALLGQVQRIAASIGVPPEAYLDLAAGALDDVVRLGPADALTGPVSRGDWATVDRHLEALDPVERDAYRALALVAARLADREPPVWLSDGLWLTDHPAASEGPPHADG